MTFFLSFSVFPFAAFHTHTHTLRVLQQTSHYDLLQQEGIQHIPRQQQSLYGVTAFQRRFQQESMFNEA
jgi:hypothetical protein